MSVAKSSKGTELPLMKLKGKDYMLVAHRILWFNDDVNSFSIHTEFPVLTDEQTVARATICIYNENGAIIKSATATKRETKKDFNDHTEKAETGAIGRAVTLLGFGTAFALADLDEGSRIIDAPLERKPVTTQEPVTNVTNTEGLNSTPKKTTFRKPNVKEENQSNNNGWE